MATVDLHENFPGRILIWSELREKELIKQVPGTKWNADAKIWTVPHSWAACVQLRGVFGADLVVGPTLAAWSRNELTTRVLPCLQLREAEDSPELAALLTQLYPYQRAGIQFMRLAGSVCNADDMGLGKTVQSITTVELEDAFPVLVICPNTMKFVWRDEWAKWFPGRKVGVIHGDVKKRRAVMQQVKDGELDVAVINWEGLRTHTRLAGYGYIKLDDKEKQEKELNEIPWKTVIADEAHRAKEPKSKQTRALWWLGRTAERRIALTGTPIANAPDDLWSIMHFVEPNEWPTKSQFIDRYALQSWNSFGFMEAVGIRNEVKDELFKILDARFIRRPKKVALPWLPDKTYVKRDVTMSAKQKKAYDTLRKEMLVELNGGILLATNPLARMVRLTQFASAMGQLDAAGNLVLTEPSCKIDALEELVEEIGDRQMVIAAESRQLIEMAVRRLVKLNKTTGLIAGGVSADERVNNVNAFQQGNLQFMCLTMGAGGEGITLTAADALCFLQRSFSLIKNKQTEDRIHRPGQDSNKVEIIDLVTLDTLEAHVHEVMVEKGDRLEEIARDELTLRRWLNK